MEIGMDYTQGEAVSDSTETANLAALSFVEYFLNNFEEKGLTFHVCEVKDAVSDACLTSSYDTRKVLLLYFHNKEDAFSKIFCENIARVEVKEMLEKKFFLLGWDVENNEYHNALKMALNSCNELSNLANLVETKTCAALLIVPIKDSITLFSCIRGKTSKKDFLATLKKAEEFLLSENKIEQDLATLSKDTEDDMGPINYQQLMLDLLGDRDYDAFEYDQHKFLKEKIAYALYGPPQNEKGYEAKENKKVDFLYKVIMEQNNAIAKWHDRIVISFIYNCTEPLPHEKLKRAKKYEDYIPSTDVTPLPVFVLRKCKYSDNPCRIFIDDSGRVYKTWDEYLRRNKLHRCQMTLPKNGRYQADCDGNVQLEKYLSPACGIDAKILQGTDIASTAAGLVSTGIIVAAAIPTITVAPVALIVAGATGLGVGLYSIGRSAYSLYDRSKHKETLSFANSEARGAYLNIVAGSLGFVGAGANIAVSQLAAQGFNIGRGATAAVNVISIANISASGISVVNSGYDVFDQWWNENQRPSLLTVVQLTSNILFFGHAVYNFKSAATIIEESQAGTLMEYQDSLRSNRHKKTFNKLMKETIRRNGGDIAKGQAEVISAIKNIQNKDEVFAVLTRSNKEMNKNGIKFSAENGEIHLNGVSIDMVKFAKMEKNEVITFLSQMPSAVEPTQVELANMSTRLQNLYSGISALEAKNLAFGMLRIFGNSTDDIKDKIINAVALIIKTLLGSPEMYMCTLDTMFPNHAKYFALFKMVGGYFQTLVDEVENQYQRWLATQDPSYEEPIYVTFARDSASRAIQIFNYVSKAYFLGTRLTEAGLREILNYFYTWLTKQIVAYEANSNRKEKRVTHSASPADRVSCTVCGGITYH